MDREWVDTVLGHEIGYQMWGHIADGIAWGIRPEAIVAIYEDRLDDLTVEERASAEYITAFVRGEVSERQWDALVGRFGARGAVEYTGFCGHLLMCLRMMQAMAAGYGGESRELSKLDRYSTEEILSRVSKIVSGEFDLSDPRIRIPRVVDG
jgi:hypothetical protein